MLKDEGSRIPSKPPPWESDSFRSRFLSLFQFENDGRTHAAAYT